jgi:hypothetical protein
VKTTAHAFQQHHVLPGEEAPVAHRFVERERDRRADVRMRSTV